MYYSRGPIRFSLSPAELFRITRGSEFKIRNCDSALFPVWMGTVHALYQSNTSVMRQIWNFFATIVFSAESPNTFNKSMRGCIAHKERKLRNEDILIIDNCGGHEYDWKFPGARIELFPAWSIWKYQTLELGPIAHPKIRYRSTLLRRIVDNTLRRSTGGHQFL